MATESILCRYADLLVNYCLSLEPGQRLYVSSTTLAEPLVREVWRAALRAGGVVETDLSFREQERILMLEGSDEALAHAPLLYRHAMEHFDAFIHIRAPFNLRELQTLDEARTNKRREAFAQSSKIYFERTATRALKRNLCQFPTLANAQEAGLSLEEYETFVYKACKLFEEDPIGAWRALSKSQQRIVDHLNRCSEVHFKGPDVDIRFSTAGRTWINSDGQTNMPSGEVYTSPVEDSVNGTILFSYPLIHAGHEIEGVRFWVRDGYIEKWEARRGQALLDQLLQLPGARRFGEAAIGTNYQIDRFTKNILFDEKIGGTVHMAIGQSYLQTGGKNQSPIHLDLIADMRQGGEISADGELIYRNGEFLI
ncbi:MAG: aminopeptidase [Saprospiraceae bacterium]|nr:MAG: aminopeptidase [Saprospiraceae bacterium]